MVDLISIAVSVVLSLGIMCVGAWFLAKKVLFPGILGVVEENLGDAQKAVSRGMAALGEKSGQVRQVKKMEKAVFGDLLANYPEIKIFLETVSPDTAELIEENPEIAAQLVARWMPVIQKIAPQILGNIGKNAPIKQNYDF